MIKEMFKYVDLFGTEFTFYSDGQKKRYTSFGGILTIITIILYILGTIFINLEDFKLNNPIIVNSELPFNKNNTKNAKSNKIWIPWRIIDKNNNYINISELISFNINYRSNNEKQVTENLNVNNRLCNETSIKIKEDSINNIIVPLDLLYCIELDYNYFYDNYMIMDILIFDENCSEDNKNCDSRKKNFKKIKNNNNELKIEIFFPVIRFQPISKKNPFYFEYKKHFYFFNENTYKIDYLFLQEYIFNDDPSLIIKKTRNTSYFGFNSLSSDYYFMKEEKELYSLNINLDSNIIYYKRSYKKVYIILAESFPLFFVLFLFFEKISQIFKIIEDKKIIFESLFENIAEKPDKFAEFQSKISPKKIQIDENRSMSNNNILLEKNSNNCSINNINQGNINNISVIINKKDIPKKTNFNILSPVNKRKNHLVIKENFLALPIPLAHPDIIYSKSPKPGSCVNNNSFSNFHLKFKQEKTKMIKFKNPILFPYKYYLLSIFCKNMTKVIIDNIKYNKNFKKFLNINVYVGKFLDITGYISLHKEFHVLKEKIFNKKNVSLLEDAQKININDQISMHTILKNVCSKNESSIIL